MFPYDPVQFRGLAGEVISCCLHTIKGKTANWIGHILFTNCLPKYATEGKMAVRIGVTGGRGRRRKQLLDGLREKGDTGTKKRKH